MAQYPQFNFNAMRQDAIRRSKEMQRRAVPQKPDTNYIEPPKPDVLPSTSRPANGLPSLNKELQTLLSGWDGERIALLALLYLLYKEGADLKLLLAIAYIIL